MCAVTEKIAESQQNNALGIMLAHELRTPLMTIQMGASAIKDFLNKLIQTYEIAKQNQLIIPEIQQQQIDRLVRVLDNIESEAHVAGFFTNLVSYMLRSSVDYSQQEKCHVAVCLHEVINTFPASLIGKYGSPKIRCNIDDFIVAVDKYSLSVIFSGLLYSAILLADYINSSSILISNDYTTASNSLLFMVEDGLNVNESIYDEYYLANNEVKLLLAFLSDEILKINGSLLYNTTTNDRKSFRIIFEQA